jgi:hypothetical protein
MLLGYYTQNTRSNSPSRYGAPLIEPPLYIAFAEFWPTCVLDVGEGVLSLFHKVVYGAHGCAEPVGDSAFVIEGVVGGEVPGDFLHADFHSATGEHLHPERARALDHKFWEDTHTQAARAVASSFSKATWISSSVLIPAIREASSIDAASSSVKFNSMCVVESDVMDCIFIYVSQMVSFY